MIHIAVRTHGALGRGKRHLRIVVEQRIDIGLALGVDRIAHAIIMRLNRLEYIAFGGEVELGVDQVRREPMPSRKAALRMRSSSSAKASEDSIERMRLR